MQIKREVYDIDDNFVGQLNIESEYPGIILYPEKELIVDNTYNVYSLYKCNIKINKTGYVNTGIIINSIPRGYVIRIKPTIGKNKEFVGYGTSVAPSPECNTFGNGFCHMAVRCIKGSRYYVKYPLLIRLFFKIFFPRIYKNNLYSHIYAGQKIGEFIITKA